MSSDAMLCVDLRRKLAGETMRTKETVRELLDRLPDECTLQDVLYHLYVISEIEQGTRELDEGRGIPHEEVERELRRKWRLGAE
jgi:predicted transcriptional regulator